MCQSFVDPEPRRGESGVGKLVNRGKLHQFGVGVKRGEQYASALVWCSLRIAQFDDFCFHPDSLFGIANPPAHEWNRQPHDSHVLLGPRLVIRNIGDMKRWRLE